MDKKETKKKLKNADITAKKQHKRKVGKPFKKGQSGNPDGRPKGTKNYTTLLEEAIKDYESATGKKLFERLIQRAFVSDMVLLNVIKKFVPDKERIEHTTDEPIEIKLIKDYED